MKTHMTLLLAVALISSQAGLIELVTGASPSAGGSSDLVALCKGAKLDIQTVSQFLNIAEALEDTNPAECSEKAKNAIRNLAEIARDELACTMKKAQAISKFVEDHLKVKTGGEASERAKLPEALTNFAIAYGMRVSTVCKEYVMNDFSHLTDRELRRRFDNREWVIMDYLSKSSPLSYVLLPILKTAEVVLPSDLMQLVPGMDFKVGEYVSDSEALAKLKSVCRETLQPLYEPVLLPLAQLMRAGFNYRGDFSYPKDHKEIAQFWSVAVFLCETVKTIEVTDKREESELDGEIEACSLPRETSGGAVEETKADTLEQKRRFFLSALRNYKNGTQLNYLKPKVEVGDEIIGKRRSSLKALVKSFDTNKEEVERFREMVLNRSLLLFKMVFKKSGHGGNFLRKLLKGFRKNSDKELEEARKGLLMLASAPEGSSALHHTVKTPIYLYKTVKWIIIKIMLLVYLLILMPFACFSERLQDTEEKLWDDLLLGQ